MRFAGRRALVTGGARGIGRAVAQRLADDGARVAIVDVDGAANAADELNALGLAADVANEPALQHAISRAVEAFGGLDVVIANAAIQLRRDDRADRLALEVWQRTLDVNLTGAFHLVETSTWAATEDPDAELLARLRCGVEAAFLERVGKYGPVMKRVALTYVRTPASAEEVVQDAWLGVLRSLERFEGRSSMRTWLLRILANRARTRAVREARCVPFFSLMRDEDEEAAGSAAGALPRSRGPLPRGLGGLPDRLGDDPGGAFARTGDARLRRRGHPQAAGTPAGSDGSP
jgi:hypothetical protein